MKNHRDFAGMVNRITELLLIKPDEQRQVVYFLVLFFCIGAGMALGRGASEALFFKRYGIEYLPLMFIIGSLCLATVSLLYAAFVDRLPSERFYRILFFLLAVLLAANWYATRHTGNDLVYPAFFLLYEVASELLLIHSVVYIHQNLVQTQSKRLMPIILAGHQIGVIGGGVLLAAASPWLGVENMMLLWMGLLGTAYVIVSRWHRQHGLSPYFRPGRKAKSGLSQSLHHVGQGLRLMKTSKLLRLSSYSLFFMVISVYVLAYSVNTVYTRHFTSEQELSAFFGLLTAATGTLALLIQLLLTNRLIRDYGVKKLNYIFPLTSLVSYAGLLFSFMLPAAIFASFNRETLMPAFAKPVRNIFTATLPNQVQGRAQAISVIMVIPLGLICAGLFLLLAQKLDTIHYFLFAGLLCSLAYLLCNAGMNRAYAREILLNLKKRLFIPDKQIHAFMDGKQPELIREIEQGLMSHEDDISIVYARVLSKSEPQLAAQLIPQRMSRASNAVKDQMVKILQPVECDAIKNQLRSELGRGDTHLDATLMKALFQSRDPAARQQVATLLNDENPRLRAAGIYGALRYPVPELIEQAVAEWIHLLEKLEADTFMPAVELIVPEFSELYQAPPLLEKVQSKLTAMLHHEEPRFISIALNILATWPAGSLTGMDQTILSLAGNHNWIIRKACVRTAHLLADNAAHTLLFTALEDPHPNVRLAAIEYLAASQVNDISYIQHLLISTRSGSPKAQQTMLEYLMDNGCDSGTLHAISLSLANDARSLKAASLSLTNHARPLTPAASLLRHALDERVLEITDLALFATQSSGQDEDMAVIRAGLRSQDKRQFAQACELLSMINNQPLSQLILPLFDDSPVPLKQEPPTFASLNALVDWIQQRADPWLNECALYFSATLDNSTLSKPCHV